MDKREETRAFIALIMESDLGDSDLMDLEKRYGSSEPTRPCVVCGATAWSLQAIGRGRETWACKASMPSNAGGTGATFDWDHYGKSSHEKVSGDDRVISLIAEVRRRRATAGELAPPPDSCAQRIFELVTACDELNHGSPRDVDDTISGIQAALKRVHEIMPGGRHG